MLTQRLLVNIRGCNGSGKSTIPMSMLDDEQLQVIPIHKNYDRPRPPFITVFPTYGWVALGTYWNKTGGMDTFSNNKMTQDALRYAWTKFPMYDVLMEGVIASTIKSTYKDLFNEYETAMEEGTINPRKIIIMSFLPPVETCIERVYARNGGNPVKEDQIRSKWRAVERNVGYFLDEGFTSLRINTAKVPKERMLSAFLKTCDKYRED